MAFTHVVTFKWREDGLPDDDAIATALRSLIGTVEGVSSYRCGPDVGMTPGAYDFAVVGTFDNRETYIAYRDSPEHQRIVNEMILPNVESRTAVQLED